MATQVVMPKLSPTMEEGQLARWLKQEGDTVSMGEPIAEIDTDKATMEMQALAAGVLRKILIQPGESAPLGQVIAIIGAVDEDISAAIAQSAPIAKAAPAAVQAAEPVPAVQASAPAAPLAAQNGTASEPASNGRIVISPIAARMAAEAGLSAKDLHGSGPGGRIIKRDVEAAIAGGAAQTRGGAVPATDSVQRGFFVRASGASNEPAPFHDEPMSEMRRTIAKRLVSSIGPVPHFFLTAEIEMDRALELRRSLLDQDAGLKFSVNDLIVKIAGSALLQHPRVNASFQDKAIRYYERADIGIAVAIEDGLITPIVRSVESKGLTQIGAEIREKAERARVRKLKPEEYTGATFSISNLGMMGIDEFTAVINPPEAAILAVGAITAKPVVRDGAVVVRQMMRVTMSCDHRVIDGATGAKFLQTFKKLLENPLYLIV